MLPSAELEAVTPLVNDGSLIAFLVRSGPRNAFIDLTPRWMAAFDRFIADSLVQGDLTYALVRRALETGGEPLA
ncbi:hypothetical protein BY998_108136 [Methylobacterium sp. B4]|nr:hypothetical protein BY998_108136 [Methylobacterium sp. B4]